MREGLRFESGAEPAIIHVVDGAGRQHQMYEIECLIAREMDGTRTIDDLTRIARKFMGTIQSDQVEKLVRQLAGMGLLSNIEPPERSVPVRLPMPMVDDLRTYQAPGELTLRFRAVSNDPFLEKASEPQEFDDVTSVEAEELVIEHTDAEEPRMVTSGEWEVVNPPQSDSGFGDDDDDDDFEDEQIGPTRAVDLVPVAQVPAQAPPPRAANEWRPAEVRWYSRPAVRRLRIPVALTVVITLLAVIQYPLYVTEECLVLSGQRFRVRAQVDGLLSEILVDEGDSVKKDDVLARLDPRDTETALEQAKAEVLRLTANLEKQRRGARPEELATARAAVAAALRDLGFAKREAERKTELFKQGVNSAEQRDQALRDLELKRSAANQAEAELRLVQAGSRKEEVAMAEAELRRAEVEVHHLERRQSLLTIAAPVDGTITTPRFKERLHEHVDMGEIICEIVDAQSMDVEVYVPEREVDSIMIGQPVMVKVASYPLRPLDGRVTFIAPAVAEVKGERVVRVLTKIDNPEGILREGMSGYGEIDAGKQSLLWLAVRRAIRWVRVRFLI